MLGVPTKTRVESSIKKSKPHLIYDLQVKRRPLVPVGVVASSWGGTDIQVWMGPEALRKCGGVKQTSNDTVRTSFAVHSCGLASLSKTAGVSLFLSRAVP